MTPVPFPLIDVAGPPRERGRQYGRQAAERIRLGGAHYVAQIRAMGVDAARAHALAIAFLPRIAAFDAAYAEEMEGIAEGAGVGLETVVLLNARTEVLQLARRQALPEADPDGCTGAVVLPEASAGGALIHAQNWDWKAECAETAVVLRVRRDDGPDFLTFTEAGALARSGLNAAGIAITANYLESDRDYAQEGVPLPLIRRKALEADNFAHAVRAVGTTAKSASNNMMLSHADGVAINFECAPDEAFALYPEGGLLVHANHWVHPAALAKLRDTGIANTPDSLYRDWRVPRHLEARRGQITAETVKEALSDDFATPFSVCRPPRPNVQGNLSATVAMVVMQPAAGLMEVAPLPALNRRFTTYRLHDAAPARAAVPAE